MSAKLIKGFAPQTSGWHDWSLENTQPQGTRFCSQMEIENHVLVYFNQESTDKHRRQLKSSKWENNMLPETRGMVNAIFRLWEESGRLQHLQRL